MPDTPDIGRLIGSAIERHFNTCVKCRRPYQGAPDADYWSFQALMMKIVLAIKCPDCQTDEERAEIVIRQASGIQYKLQGVLLVEQPATPPPSGDDEGPQAKAS